MSPRLPSFLRLTAVLTASYVRFLWAASQARILNQQVENDVIATASSRALSRYYQLQKFEQRVCNHAFMLIAYGHKPLTSDELFAAIEFCRTETYGMSVDEQWLRCIWPEALFLDFPTDHMPVWRLSHSSMAEHFQAGGDVRTDWSKLNGVSFVLDICIKILVELEPDPDPKKTGKRKQPVPTTGFLVPDHPLRIYARHFWPWSIYALGESIVNKSKPRVLLLRKFFGSLGRPADSPMYLRWMKDMARDVDRVWPVGSYFSKAILEVLREKTNISTICYLSLATFLTDWLDDMGGNVTGSGSEKEGKLSELPSDVLFEINDCMSWDSRILQVGRKLIDLGFDPNQPDVFAHAIRVGSTEWVELLLEKGADIHADSSGVAEAMIEAAEKKEGRTVRLLLGHGMPPDAGPNRDSALSAASEAADLETVEALIKAGANVNRRLRGHTGSAVTAATLNPDAMPILQLLIEHGADIRMRGGWLGSPLVGACSANNTVAIALLIDHGTDVNEPVSVGKYGSALVAAAAYDSQLALRALIDAGADLHQLTLVGEYGSALVAAAHRGSLSCLRDLINAGADVNRPVSAGNFGNSLIAAAAGGHLSCLQALLDAGADVKAKTKHGYYTTALEAAASKGKLDCLEALLENGAEIDDVRTLSGAVSSRDVGCVRALLRAGVDVNHPGYSNVHQSALDVAVSVEKRDILDALISAGADANILNPAMSRYGTPLINAVANRSSGFILPLTRAGARLDQEVSVGWFSTALAAAIGVVPFSPGVLRNLVAAGANVNGRVAFYSREYFGTALIAAAYLGKVRCVRTLIEVGADVKLRVEGGRFRDALEAAMAPVTEEDAKLYKSILPMPGSLFDQSKGLVEDKRTVVALLKEHGG